MTPAERLLITLGATVFGIVVVLMALYLRPAKVTYGEWHDMRCRDVYVGGYTRQECVKP